MAACHLRVSRTNDHPKLPGLTRRPCPAGQALAPQNLACRRGPGTPHWDSVECRRRRGGNCTVQEAENWPHVPTASVGGRRPRPRGSPAGGPVDAHEWESSGAEARPGVYCQQDIGRAPSHSVTPGANSASLPWVRCTEVSTCTLKYLGRRCVRSREAGKGGLGRRRETRRGPR